MKRLLLILFLLFSSATLFAQEFPLPYQGFRLGLTAHPTIGWVKPQTGKSNGVALGFAYGLLADFNFAENYSFATGLTITTINGKSTEIISLPSTVPGQTPNQVPFDIKYKLQYIEVPLTVKLKTVNFGDVRYYGQFGLSGGFNIGAKQDTDASGMESTRGANIKDDIKFFRAGLVLGAGGEFDLKGNASITAGLTYNNGLSDIRSESGVNVRNHYLSLNFGVFF